MSNAAETLGTKFLRMPRRIRLVRGACREALRTFASARRGIRALRDAAASDVRDGPGVEVRHDDGLHPLAAKLIEHAQAAEEVRPDFETQDSASSS